MYIDLASHYFELVLDSILHVYVCPQRFSYRLKDPLLRIIEFHSLSVCCVDFVYMEPTTIKSYIC